MCVNNNDALKYVESHVVNRQAINSPNNMLNRQIFTASHMSFGFECRPFCSPCKFPIHDAILVNTAFGNWRPF